MYQQNLMAFEAQEVLVPLTHLSLCNQSFFHSTFPIKGVSGDSEPC